MTTYETVELDFDAVQIEGDTKATVERVANDWHSDDDWRRFEKACREAATISSLSGPAEVDPDVVRGFLRNWDGELTINPRRLSAFYHRAAGKSGFLDFSHWGINGDHKGRNAGRPARIYQLRPTSRPAQTTAVLVQPDSHARGT